VVAQQVIGLVDEVAYEISGLESAIRMTAQETIATSLIH
jgi:hypothetical protein